jgi:Flp pilus assembly protein TadD
MNKFFLFLLLTAFCGTVSAQANEHYFRGFSLFEAGDVKGAVAAFNLALEEDPAFGEAYIQRAAALLKLGDLKGAISDCSAAIELKPENAEAFYTRGIAFFNTGDKNSACEDWTKASELGDFFADELLQNYCR